MPRYKLKRLFLLVLAPITYFLVSWAKKNPQDVEEVYSRKFYHVISSGINTMTSFVKFSLAEIIVIIFLVGSIYYILSSIVKIIYVDSSKRVYRVYVFFVNIAVSLSTIIFMFVVMCGLNYYRIPFAEQYGFVGPNYTKDDLYNLAVELADECNRYRELVKENQDGVMVLSQELHEQKNILDDKSEKYIPNAGTLQLSSASMSSLAKEYSVFDGLYFEPKPVKFSGVMSKMGITGVFFPFTYEANVNVNASEYSLPFTMAHELAHLRGFMKEDEANFIAYLACINSDSDDFLYSGNMMALSYVLSELSRVDSNGYQQVVSILSDGVMRDRKANSEYWSKQDGVTQTVANAVNDTYLKANSQESGVQSYNEMVELLLSYRSKIMEQESLED